MMDLDTDLDAEAAALLRELPADPWGEVSPSVYETGRVVSLAPWLKGHRARLEFLYRGQEPDGTWGGPGGYALVPTLSATEALLSCLRRTPQPGARMVRAVDRGLATLRRWSTTPVSAVPDTIAVEVVVPALVAAINRHLAEIPWPAAGRLRVPEGMCPDMPAGLAARIAAGAPVPPTWPTSLEALGAAVPAGAARPHDGAVGCSPAATAAWLALQPSRTAEVDAATTYLDALQARNGGPVPGVTPITYFERAWVLASLGDAFDAPVSPGVLDHLAAGLGPAGAPAAPGLPPDCDDSAVVLTALDRYGRGQKPDCLLTYRTAGHFRCFAAERTPSTSTNAHALETILRGHPADRHRLAAVVVSTADWLLQAQHADGSWWDKWHASPYYATFCCAQALALLPDKPAPHAIDRAADWVLATQRDDGSWGIWGGTVEETSYAIQILVRGTRWSHSRAARAAVRSGAFYLQEQPQHGAHRPLWHAKDLYAPGRVIRAARLAALAVAATVAGAPVSPGAGDAAWLPPAPRSAPARRAPAGSGVAARPR
jgi:halimadienyl-diphosphate synthase